MQHEDKIASHDWKEIWRLKVPERIKSFVWLLKRDRLLTNQIKSRRGLGAVDCKLCEHSSKTMLHVFRECPCAMEVCVNKVPTEMHHDFFNLELEDWINLNLIGIVRRILVGVIIGRWLIILFGTSIIKRGI